MKILFLALLFVSSVAYGKTDCEIDLAGPAERAINAEVLEQTIELSPIESSRPDLHEPRMRVLEDLNKEKQNEKELLTARDYARFLRSRYDQTFLFIAKYRGRSVPIFDGIVFDENGLGSANVSLKYTSFQHKKPHLPRLLESLRARLNVSEDLEALRTPVRWFSLVTGVFRDFAKARTRERHLEDVERSAELASFFGLFHAPLREYRVVVDMRESGYTFDFCATPENLSALDDMVGETAKSGVTLTLLWDSKQALEFNGQDHISSPIEHEYGFRPKVAMKYNQLRVYSREPGQELLGSLHFNFKGDEQLTIDEFTELPQKHRGRGVEKFMLKELLNRFPNVLWVRLPDNSVLSAFDMFKTKWQPQIESLKLP